VLAGGGLTSRVGRAGTDKNARGPDQEFTTERAELTEVQNSSVLSVTSVVNNVPCTSVWPAVG
jgi:hypothetical protein